jgi:uncharacterized cupredoxin-like copper-binding protein
MRNLILILTFTVVACGREAGESASATGTNPPQASTSADSTMSPVVPTSSDFPGNKIGGAATPSQQVELSEYQIRMPQSLAAGKHSFSVVNSGKETHNFEIEGNGIEAKLPSDVSRGDSATLDVDLKPGTYTVYCPVKGHKEKGMTTTLVVK